MSEHDIETQALVLAQLLYPSLLGKTLLATLSTLGRAGLDVRDLLDRAQKEVLADLDENRREMLMRGIPHAERASQLAEERFDQALCAIRELLPAVRKDGTTTGS